MDLGNLTEACIVRPETCGEGAAMAFWMRVEDNTQFGRRIMLAGEYTKTGFLILYVNQTL